MAKSSLFLWRLISWVSKVIKRERVEVVGGERTRSSSSCSLLEHPVCGLPKGPRLCSYLVNEIDAMFH